MIMHPVYHGIRILDIDDLAFGYAIEKAEKVLDSFNENEVINEADVSCIFGEVNLQKNCELYRRYYHINKPWIVHPFVYAERFQNKTPFSKRKNMAFATGTITYKTHEEFISTYGEPCDQPSRKQIKDNPEFFTDTIYCTSSDYLEDNARYTWYRFCRGDGLRLRIYRSGLTCI